MPTSFRSSILVGEPNLPTKKERVRGRPFAGPSAPKLGFTHVRLATWAWAWAWGASGVKSCSNLAATWEEEPLESPGSKVLQNVHLATWKGLRRVGVKSWGATSSIFGKGVPGVSFAN